MSGPKLGGSTFSETLGEPKTGLDDQFNPCAADLSRSGAGNNGFRGSFNAVTLPRVSNLGIGVWLCCGSET
jgi:hypothetical protein